MSVFCSVADTGSATRRLALSLNGRSERRILVSFRGLLVLLMCLYQFSIESLADEDLDISMVLWIFICLGRKIVVCRSLLVCILKGHPDVVSIILLMN